MCIRGAAPTQDAILGVLQYERIMLPMRLTHLEGHASEHQKVRRGCALFTVPSGHQVLAEISR
jgi:hypothetical protein